MIKAEDVRFHTPADVQYDWAETNFFSVYLPDPNITAWIYTIARPGIGAMVSDVEVIDGIGRTPVEALYVDFQQHLPIPERLENYTLPNGLSLQTANEPRDYRIHYKGVDDTEFQWTVTGLMDPFDIHDPDMDPLASDEHAASGFGSAYANHFDMTVHVVGTTRIRGKTFDVDCVTTMDHSWGPRNERGLKPMGWINGTFAKDFAFHTIWSFNPMAEGWDQFALAHGYILTDDGVHGLTQGRIRASRSGPFAGGYETILTDRTGRDYAFQGLTVAQHPWAPYSSCLSPFSTVRWTHDGREGFGLAQENWPLDLLTGQMFRA